MKKLLLLASLCALVSPAIAQHAARPAITGIAFARFYTTDAAAAQKFYGDTLGLKREQADDMLLYPVNRSQWIELVPSTPPHANDRFAAVGVTTRDAGQLERYLEAHGVKPELPLKDGQFGVRDPEGNLVIFVERGSEKAVANSAPSANATSKRIIHVGFIVHDPDKENAFWRDLLGFRPLWHGGRNETETDWISSQVPDGSDWIEFMLNTPPNPSLKQSGTSDHVSLGTAHMQDVIDTLARNHCEGSACNSPKIGRDGKVQLNLFDPDQTRVEFMEFKPTREPCCSPITGKVPTDDEEQ